MLPEILSVVNSKFFYKYNQYNMHKSGGALPHGNQFISQLIRAVMMMEST